MRYIVSNYNIKIIDSYKVLKKNFTEILNDIKEKYPKNLVMKERNMFSMTMEWAVHNFLYNINYKRERTKDVDLNYPQKWYISFAYNIIGIFAWIFIR